MIWKTYIKDFYEVSDKGNIRRIGGKILSKTIGNHGYYSCMFSVNGDKHRELVHRVVGMVFIENKEDKPNINHKDGNKLNNNVENLEWVTQQENIDHSFSVLGNEKIRKGKFGGEHNCSKIVLQYKDGEFIREYEGLREAARILGVSHSSISNVCNGRRKTLKGFTFKLKDNGNK